MSIPFTALTGGGDSLTRTTLQIGGSPSQSLISDVIHALQRVPGVLLADVNPVNAQALVAHDGAVPTGALVSAASGVGATATIVADKAAPSEGRLLPLSAAASVPASILARPTIVLMMVAAVAHVLIGAFAPDVPAKHIVINALVVGVWVCFFAGLYVRRRP